MRSVTPTQTPTPGVQPAPMMMEATLDGPTVDMEIQMVSCIDIKKFH